MSRHRLVQICAFLFLLCASVSGWASIRGNSEPFTSEVTQSLVVEQAGEPVESVNVSVVYYPGSNVEREEMLGETNAQGAVRWTPRYAGLARLSWTATDAEQGEVTESRVVGVRYPGPPLSALIMFGVTVCILYGVLFVGIFRMGRVEES